MPRRFPTRFAAAFGLLLLSASPRGAAAAAAPDTVLRALFTQAHALSFADRWTAADSVAALAFERARRPEHADSVAMTRALYLRANARFEQATFRDTITGELLAHGIDIQRHMTHPDTGLWVGSIDLLARLLSERDHVDSALVLVAQGRALCLPSVADVDSLLGNLWITTGRCLRRREQYDRALAVFDSSRAVRERRNGPAFAGVAEALAEIGAVEGRRNRLEEAQAALERAVVIFGEGSGGDGSLAIRPLTELASVQYQAGDIARSIETLEHVIALTIRSNGPDSPRLIPPLFNIALRLYDFGDYAGAQSIFASLVPRAETSFGSGSTRTEYVRIMAGASALWTGDTASAARYLTPARTELLAKPIDPNHLADLLERHYAQLLLARGDAAGAARVLEAGLARERATSQPIAGLLILLLDYRITVCEARHDSLGLDSTLREMDARFGPHSGAGAILLGDYLTARARAERWRGRRDDATRCALQSEELDRERLLRNVRALPDERAIELAGELSDPLELLVSLARDGDEASIATAWDRLVRWRGIVTAEMALKRAPHAAAADTALAAAHARWLQAMRRAARLEVEDAAGGGASPAFTASRAEADAAEQRYAALAAARGIPRDTTAADLARLRAALAPDQALVSLVTIAGHTDTARVVGFVTRGPAGPLRRIDLGSSRVLADRVAAWRAALETPPARGRERERESQCRALGLQVKSRTWDRLAPLFAGANGVVLVADGVLGDLPWPALPDARGRYLVESGPEIQTPDAERELLAPPARTGHGLLALGDPDFDTPADTALVAVADSRGAGGDCDPSATALPPLPGARAEVSDIAAAWNADHADRAAAATSLVGAAATERAFKALAPGREVLHVATHGIVTSERCAPAYAGLRGVGGMSPAPNAANASAPAATKSPPRPAATAAPSSPWSGRQVWLAFAGANRARGGGAQQDEGLLTADEVVSLDLSDVQWVVLSACHSGAGEQWPLEGSVGMRRAFRLAGAHAVIASQWAIADEPTREWMRALYAHRAADDASAGRAMRDASRSVLAARRRSGRTTHPYYWAAFTATGR